MRIVTDVPGPGLGARAGRAAVLLVGYLLVLAGLLLAVPALPLAILLPIGAVTGEEISLQFWAVAAGLVLGTVVCLWLGLRLIRGRRHLVLFLRRFGFEDASGALTYAVSGALGRRWRLVTLDDSEIAPVGVAHSSRVAWGAGRWIALMLLLVVLAGAAAWTFGGGLDGMLDGVMDSAFEDAAEQSEDPVESIVGGAIAAVIVGVLVVTFLFIVLILIVSALGIAAVGFWRGDRALRRAEGAKALVLTEETAITRTVQRIKRGASGIFAPRLVVVKVHDAIWREVVHELARDASVALIDVSEPTEHLLWEVDLLRREASMRMLAIGRRDLVESIATASGGSVQAQLRDLLVGQDVLVYDVGRDGRPTRRFAGNLGSALDRVGS